MRDIRVAAAQMEHQPGDKSANLAKIRAMTQEARAKKVEIIVFPEMCITGYWYVRDLDRAAIEALAESVPDGPSSLEIIELSKQTGMSVGAGLIERADDGTLYNAYLVAMPDGSTAVHRKLHCFISEHMASGSEYTVFDTPHGCRAGILICYDNNIGENVRIAALKGADILLAPHQTGGCKSPDPHTMGLVDRALWENREKDPEAIEKEFCGPKGRAWLLRWLPTRAHDNGLFLVFSNGVGIDGDEVRTGNAMVIDTYGRILTETWKAQDEIVVADLDAALREKNSGRRWIKSRRPELYGPIAVPTGEEEDTRILRFKDA